MEPEVKRILIVEDNPGDKRLLVELLNENGTCDYSLNHADRIAQALEILSKNEFNLLLLDLTLPDSTGLETVRQICSAAPHLPIIVFTALEDDELAIEAVQIGAQDYLVKNQVNRPLLIRAMSHAMERKKMEERLHFLATHDNLTNLPNRALFQDRLSLAIERAQRNRWGLSEKINMAVMLLDLDNFKEVNDTLGHPQGDLLLQLVADRLHHVIRASDTVARMGGDEFMLIFENITGMEDARILGEKILSIFTQSFQLSNHLIHISASIGISLFPEDGEDFMSLMQTSDIAMYFAKRKRNRYCFYRFIKDEL